MSGPINPPTWPSEPMINHSPYIAPSFNPSPLACGAFRDTFAERQPPMPDFSRVFEAWDQPSTVSKSGWTYTPAVGTYGEGLSSHFTYRPNGVLDHYSVYDGLNKKPDAGFKFNW